MATLAGVAIADKGAAFELGAALLLQQVCRVDEVIPLGADWEVEVRSGSPYVVARGKGPTIGTSGGGMDAAQAFASAYEAAQKALDVLSLTGAADLSIRDAMDESLVWWREGATQVLRVISTVRMGFSFIAEVEVRDQSGNVKSQPPVPPPQYHECLRYFRLAQVTDDLFDAYRNLWLSFELLLSSQYPKTSPEVKWLHRALTQAHNSFDLTNVYQSSGRDVAKDIVDELYVNARLPLFHATASRTVFVPHSLKDRETVGEALRKLSGLLLFLIEKWLNAKRLGGGITHYAFESLMKGVLANSEVLVSDKDTPLDPALGTRADAGFDPAVSMATRHAPELSSPGRQFWLGEVSSADLQELTKIARFAVATGDKVFSHHEVEAELTHDGVDRLEAQMGFYAVNARGPKYLFTA